MEKDLKDLMLEFQITTEAELFTTNLDSKLRILFQNTDYDPQDLSHTYNYSPEIDQESSYQTFNYCRNEIIQKYKNKLHEMISDEYDVKQKRFCMTMMAVALYLATFI